MHNDERYQQGRVTRPCTTIDEVVKATFHVAKAGEMQKQNASRTRA